MTERFTGNSEQEKEIRYEARKTLRRRVWDYIAITAASLIYAAAVGLFLDPNSLAPGGVTGISVILNRVTGLQTGTWMLLINIPILAVGTWKFGLRFILSTMYSTALTSYFTNRMTSLGAVTHDPLLAALAGGAMIAVALGMVFKAGATTGGTDIIIKLLRLRFPHLRTGSLFLITDALIVACSALVFRDIDIALYAGLVVVVNSLLLDLVLYGRDGAKLLFIISEHPEKIVDRLLDELDVGVTYLSGRGAYSGREKRVIMCVIKKQHAYKAEEIVRQEEPRAFTIVTGATEIFGEGYKSIFSERM